MYDTHIHTNCSPDSEQTFDMICQSAIKKGLKAVTLTDHLDLLIYTDERNTGTVSATAECGKKAREIYGDKLEIYVGAEIGMASLDNDKATSLAKMIDADVVLGSVHSFLTDEGRVRFSYDDLSKEAVSTQKLYENVGIYYKNILDVAANASVDVLCHLTYPIRYTNKKYNRGIDIHKFSDILEKIMKTIIDRGIALEINTGKYDGDCEDLAPTPEIIKKYYEMGGRLVTIGSDAHTPEKVGNGFTEVKKLLKEIGFEGYVYYKKRKPVRVNL